MLNDVGTIIWKEWKEIIARGTQNRADSIKTIAILALIMAIVVWRASSIVNNPGALLVPSFVLVQMLIAFMVDSFAGERERHTLETLLASRLSDSAILIGKIASGVLLVWGLIFITLALSIATAYARNALQRMTISFGDLSAILIVYLLICLVVSCACVLVSLRAATVRQAVQTLTWSMMILFFIGVFAFARLSPEWRATLMRALAADHLLRTELIAISFLAGLAGVLFGAARLRFRRARLILD
jgi:ABC-2 type transport system permease protein